MAPVFVSYPTHCKNRSVPLYLMASVGWSIVKPDRNTVLLAVVTLLVLPCAVWAALALIAKFWNAKLGPMLPWLRGVRWALWIAGTPLFLVGVVSPRFFWLVPVGISLTGCSSGLSLAEGWLKKRYAPELLSAFERLSFSRKERM
jgi:hypothetical protein